MNKFDKWISITYAEVCGINAAMNHASAAKFRLIGPDTRAGR